MSISILKYPIIFFFSSRRRHTRSVSAFLLNRSSDLVKVLNLFTLALVRFPPTATKEIQYLNAKGALTYTDIAGDPEIGRASCRERVYIQVGVVALRKIQI